MQSETHTDDELLIIKGKPGLWLVRGGLPPVLGQAYDLQAALIDSYRFATGDQTVLGIVKMPNDEVMVPPHQIHRLWERLRIPALFPEASG